MNKNEMLKESRKKVKEKITSLEIKMEVLQDNLDDTKTAIRELKNIFIQIDEKFKELKK
jgi:hypothetical protein